MSKEKPTEDSEDAYSKDLSDPTKMNSAFCASTTNMSVQSIGDMHKYEKVMTLFNELPNIYETSNVSIIGSTSNNMYSGDEFDDNQEIEKPKSSDTPSTSMTKAQK